MVGKVCIISDPRFVEMVFDLQREYHRRFRKRLTQREATALIVRAFNRKDGLNVQKIIDL